MSLSSQQLIIGNVALTSPLVLAPLAGHTDLSFRLLCKDNGASLCFSEMVSCHGLAYEQKNTVILLETSPSERPFGVQLFGSDPEVMGKAAAIISSKYSADIIDINMGCPVRKVVKKGAGSALMKSPDIAQQIIKKVCANTHLPVTVKFRSGWTHETINAVEFALMAESAGASAITVHARTWAQGFGGEADWDIISLVKKAVSIPVIGNGDIASYTQAMDRIQETNCDGVMIGRAALGNPWVFSPEGRPNNLSARLPKLRQHIELAEQYLPYQKMFYRIKHHASRYCTELPGAAEIRKKIYDCEDMNELKALINTDAIIFSAYS